MLAFFSGLAVALVLLAGSLFLFQTFSVTVAERSSPHDWVRISDEELRTAYRGPESEGEASQASADT